MTSLSEKLDTLLRYATEHEAKGQFDVAAVYYELVSVEMAYSGPLETLCLPTPCAWEELN